MFKEERHQLILDEVTRYNKVRSTDLCRMLNVSEDTVRRDLKELADKGIVRKVHGGAVANSLIPREYREQNIDHIGQKRGIAEKALSLIEDGQLIIIDGGTTNLELVRQFPEELKATVFTNSVPVAHELCTHPGIDLFMFGGKVLKSVQVTIGMDVLHFLSDLYADICFIGTRSLHPALGITTTRREEAQIKRKLAEVSAQVVSLVTSDKLGTIQPFRVIDLEQVHTIVTGLLPNDPMLTPFREKGVRVL
ncbi:MAG: DeoR/GlpR transcriptional regulator [Phaeodactylibacter sp.]|nr:DeoR/GlpR transcriptional regulator [Phaeodactylibacter sp.]MCB9047966.1 DeoR/GlpR transcriptional regulator [Lewinellaceae bacterium]